MSNYESRRIDPGQISEASSGGHMRHWHGDRPGGCQFECALGRKRSCYGLNPPALAARVLLGRLAKMRRRRGREAYRLPYFSGGASTMVECFAISNFVTGAVTARALSDAGAFGVSESGGA